MNLNQIGIYKITSPSGKIYIGQTTHYLNRLKKYRKKNGCLNQIKLHRSLNKYGWKSHIFEFIEECNIEELNNRERHYQDLYDVLSKKGLNCILTKTDNKSGKLSEELKKKLSISKLRGGNPNATTILNLETGIYYSSIIEASEAYNINYRTLGNYLSGKRKNKTMFKYI